MKPSQKKLRLLPSRAFTINRALWSLIPLMHNLPLMPIKFYSRALNLKMLLSGGG